VLSDTRVNARTGWGHHGACIAEEQALIRSIGKILKNSIW
jgi:hypothetical protein